MMISSAFIVHHRPAEQYVLRPDRADAVTIVLAERYPTNDILTFDGLVSAYLSNRWQYRNTLLQQAFSHKKDLSEARRQAYVEYVVSAQQVVDKAWTCISNIEIYGARGSTRS
ncbi:hypothetical protein [Nocardia heshunensis]